MLPAIRHGKEWRFRKRDLDAWIGKLRSDHVKFLEQPYTFGNGRAVMIEGPSLEAIELIETTN